MEESQHIFTYAKQSQKMCKYLWQRFSFLTAFLFRDSLYPRNVHPALFKLIKVSNKATNDYKKDAQICTLSSKAAYKTPYCDKL